MYLLINSTVSQKIILQFSAYLIKMFVKENDIFKITYNKDYDTYDIIVYKSFNGPERGYNFDWYTRTKRPIFRVTTSQGVITTNNFDSMIKSGRIERAGADELAKYYLTGFIK